MRVNRLTMIHVGERSTDVLGHDVLEKVRGEVESAMQNELMNRLELNETAIKISNDPTLKRAHSILIRNVKIRNISGKSR